MYEADWLAKLCGLRSFSLCPEQPGRLEISRTHRYALFHSCSGQRRTEKGGYCVVQYLGDYYIISLTPSETNARCLECARLLFSLLLHFQVRAVLSPAPRCERSCALMCIFRVMIKRTRYHQMSPRTLCVYPVLFTISARPSPHSAQALSAAKLINSNGGNFYGIFSLAPINKCEIDKN